MLLLVPRIHRPWRLGRRRVRVRLRQHPTNLELHFPQPVTGRRRRPTVSLRSMRAVAAALALPGGTARGLGAQPDAPLSGALGGRGVEKQLSPPVAPIGARGVLARNQQQPPRPAPGLRRRRRRGGGVVTLLRGRADRALLPRSPRRAAPPPLHGRASFESGALAAFHPTRNRDE